MARTKAGGASKGGSKSRRGSNAEDKKNIENGLYVHSSPPTVVDSQGGTSGSAHIREYLRRGNIAGLEEVVLEGYGNKLLTQSSTDTRVRAFLKTLPSFISKIELVHDAAERGDLRDLKSLLDRRKIARSKDSQGMGILHKAVLSGNTEMVDYLMKNYPETATVVDHDARTPLHYCAASKNPDEVYSLLSTTYDNPQARDSKGKTASNYMSRPSDLKVERRARYAANKKRTPPNKRTQKTPTPPKREGLNINGANIRIWIHDQDLPKLERIVWEGQGLKLLKETSNNPKVRQFLNLVPRMMIKIKECHQAVINNDMELLEAKADQPELLSAKDQNGLNCLHKAAALGHPEMCEWIIQRNQSSLYTADKLGRTPLFYATLPNDEEETFSTLVRGGADTKHLDRFKKKAEMYKGRSDLDLSVVYEPPIAPRSGTGLDMTFSGGTSLAPSRMTSRAPSRAPSRNVKGSRSLNPSRRNSLTDGTNGEKPIRRSKSTGRVNRARRKQEAAEDEHDDSDKMGTDGFVFEDMSDMAPDELDKLILEGDLNKLENIVLSGKGNELRGKSSWNEDVRKFLKKVPGYMENVNGLHDAADAGNLKNVKRITEKNPRLVYGRGRDGSIALHHMARSGNLAGVKHLYSLYPDGIHVLDQEGKTPVHWTAQSKKPGAKETYAFLQKMGAPTDLPDDSGQSAEDYINHLAPDGDDQNKSAKSSQKNSPANSRNGSRRNSLNPPSNNGSRRGSQSNSRKNSLKEKSPSQSREPSPSRSKPSSRRGSKNPSPSPSARSNNKSPTPSNASRRGSDRRGRGGAVSAADAAMEKEVEGAINDADKGEYEGINDIIMRGDGRLLVGRGSKDEDTQQFLDKIPSLLENIDEIHSAAEEGDKRRVANLIDKRKKASVKDSNHSNILHKSVLNGHTDLSRYLIMTYPELLHHQDRAGRTPLHYAAVVKDGGHLYKILNKAGADPTITDRDGYSPEAYIEDRGLMTEADLKEELREGIPLDGSSSRRERKESPTRLHTKDSDEPINDDGGEGDHGVDGDDQEGDDQEADNESDDKKGDDKEGDDKEGDNKEDDDKEGDDKEDDEKEDDKDDVGDAEHVNRKRRSSDASPAEYPNLWTDEGQYLSNAVGEALTAAMEWLTSSRPSKPIQALALNLYSTYLDPLAPRDEIEPPQTPSSQPASASQLNTASSIDSFEASLEEMMKNRGHHLRDINGSNALHVAATLPHPTGIFAELIRAGGIVMLSERDSLYMTPRDVAERSDMGENVAEIDGVLCKMAATGDAQSLYRLLMEGYDHIIDAEDIDGSNIIEVAERNRQRKIVHLLQEAAAHEERRELLNRAIIVGSLPHVQYLLSNELCCSRDTFGRTALHLATLLERLEILQYIVSSYPQCLSIPDSLGRTPMHFAMATDKVDTIARTLVNSGAIRNIKDLKGKLPSYYFMNRQEIMDMKKELYPDDK